MSPLQPGDVLGGRFRVEQVIGQGGMGVVVMATHLHLDQRVAIKFLLPEALANAEALHRFMQEAKAAARIQCEHVVRVFDVAALEGGAPYLVMEYLEGCDLSTLLKQRGPLPVIEAVDYLLQACEAIAEAHAAGIIHRDLKPANLFLTRRPDGSPLVKVLDFGISKLIPRSMAGDQGAMTKTRALMGSPSYMSPEQMRSTRTASPRSDIWALGVILFELLSASLPFVGETMTEICAKVLDEPVPSLRGRRGEVPPALEAVIARCLEKAPERRFHSIAAFAQALAPFASPEALVSVQRIGRLGVPPPPASGPNEAVVHTQETAATVATFGGTLSRLTRSRRPPLALVGAAGVALLLLVGITVVTLRAPSGADPPSASGAPQPLVAPEPQLPEPAAEMPRPPATGEVADAGLAHHHKKPGTPPSTKPPTKPNSTAGFGDGIE